MTMKTRIEVDAGTMTFSSGLLPELIAALRRCGPGPPAQLPTLVFLLYQKGRDSRIFQAQDGYDRRDSEQQQVTADEDRGRLVRRP